MSRLVHSPLGMGLSLVLVSSAILIGQVTVPAPVISPTGGTYGAAQLITITDTDKNATIYFTNNGATPTTSSIKYTGPIRAYASQTIKAIAVDQSTTSAVTTAAYTLIPSPQVLTGVATGISTTGVTLNGVVGDDNNVSQFWFVYGTSSTSLTSSTTHTAVGASYQGKTVGVALTGLTTKTTYYFQAVATTTGGTAYGTIQSFTTN